MNISGILDAAEKLCCESGVMQFKLRACPSVVDDLMSSFRPIREVETWSVATLNTEVGTIRIVTDPFMPKDKIWLTVDMEGLAVNE